MFGQIIKKQPPTVPKYLSSITAKTINTQLSLLLTIQTIIPLNLTAGILISTAAQTAQSKSHLIQALNRESSW